VLLQVPFFALFGPAYWYGRLLSVVAICVASVAVGAAVRRLTGSTTAALCGALAVFAVPYFTIWGVLNRVDSLALALTWTAVAVAVFSNGRPARLGLSAVLCILAGLTRQTYLVAAPCAIAAMLAAEGRFRLALRIWSGTIGGAVAIYAVLNWVTDGGFYLHVVSANQNELVPARIVIGYKAFAKAVPVLIFASCVSVLTDSKPAARALLLGYLVPAAVVALTYAKVGSHMNYFYEVGAGVAFGTGLAVAGVARRPLVRSALLVLLALQAVLPWRTRPFDSLSSRFTHGENQQRLLAMITNASKPVMADEVMGLLPIAGLGIYWQPFEMTQLAGAGRWKDEPVAAAVRAREFAAILIAGLEAPAIPTRHMYPPSIRAAIARAYEPGVTMRIAQDRIVTVYVARRPEEE
jgi:4-amino-4-deoxy-L-arabinose transferase-like glycosyltransferase